MDFNKLKVDDLNILCKNNKIKGISKMKKDEKIAALNALDKTTMNSSLEIIQVVKPGSKPDAKSVVKSGSKVVKPKSSTLDKEFDKYIKLTDNHKAKLSESKEDLTMQDFVDLVKEDILKLAAELNIKETKKYVDSYGCIKAIIEYNSNKVNKSNYLFQVSSKAILNWSETIESDIYRKLFTYLIVNNLEYAPLLKVFKVFNEFHKTTNLTSEVNNSDEEPEINYEESDEE